MRRRHPTRVAREQGPKQSGSDTADKPGNEHDGKAADDSRDRVANREAAIAESSSGRRR